MQLNYDTFSNKKRTVNFITENVIILIHSGKSDRQPLELITYHLRA